MHVTRKWGFETSGYDKSRSDTSLLLFLQASSTSFNNSLNSMLVCILITSLEISKICVGKRNVPLICISHIFFCMILCKLTNRVCQIQYSALTYVDQCFRNIFFSIHDDYSVAFVSLFNNDMTVVFFNEVNTALPVQLDYPDIVLLAEMIILVQFY